MRPWFDRLPPIGSAAVLPEATPTGLALGAALREAMGGAVRAADRPDHVDLFRAWLALSFLDGVRPCPACDRAGCAACEGCGWVAGGAPR